MILKKRKICVVTSSRADYGLLKHLALAISDSRSFQLQLVATGSHLSYKFGNTYLEIEEDGLRIDKKIDINIVGGSSSETAASTALSMEGFTKAFLELRPDLVVILGDRFELLGVAIAAMYLGLPVAHFHGGEITIGAMDDSIRHALTKLSHIHFVAADEYRNRVIQLGENPKYVFNVGGMGVDAIRRLKLLSRKDLEKFLGFKFLDKNLLITFHPITLEKDSSTQQMKQLLLALEEHADKRLIFTMPNADPDSMAISELIESFVERNKNARSVISLGQLRYYSCIAQVDGVIGNSSSGLLEVPTFRKPTINIGIRQKGRLKAASVIDCEPLKHSINHSIHKIYEDDFMATANGTINPYGNGEAVEKALNILESLNFDALLTKNFYDLPN